MIPYKLSTLMNNKFKYNVILCHKFTCILFIVLLSFFINVQSFAKPLVTITVDVERMSRCGHGLTIKEQYDLKKENTLFGISQMLNILEKHQVKGVFFYDAYEYKKDGESVKEIAIAIDKRGHDVELHTHPQWAYDPNKNYLHNYDFDQQRAIISYGKNLLEDWIGKDIVAHRAGAYGADFNTLRALQDNQIYLDSSFYYSHPWCKLNTKKQLLKKNNYSKWENVVQVPVNVFLLDDVPQLLPDLRPITYVTKYDINPYVSTETLYKAIDNAIEKDFDVIVLFLHSFSFISCKDNHNFYPDLETIKKFDNVLHYIKSRELQIVTFRDIDQLRKNNKIGFNSEDTLFHITREINVIKYFLKRFGFTKKDMPILFTISIITMIISIIFVRYLMRKRKNKIA